MAGRLVVTSDSVEGAENDAADTLSMKAAPPLIAVSVNTK